MPTLYELLAGLSYNELVVFYDRLMRAASELTPYAQAPSAGSLPKDNILAVTEAAGARWRSESAPSASGTRR
jgi:hypothetical protein